MKTATAPRGASVAAILTACTFTFLGQLHGAGAEDWLPLADPPNSGYRIAELRTFAADQCTAPVPRVKDAQLVMWAVILSELPFVEQWVRIKAVRGEASPRVAVRHSWTANPPPDPSPGLAAACCQVLHHLYLGVDLIYLYDDEEKPTYHR
jgi:hypothetical protein